MTAPDPFCPRCQQAGGYCLCPPADIPGELSGVHDTYRGWLGDDYDIGALDVVLCTAAAEKLAGDPPWLLIVGGSGAAKTETVMPLMGAGAAVISTISGEAALLSGTPAKSRAKNASGGLLRKIGPRGLLVIKDVTSILSMNRDTRALVLAALREIYDGHWSRDVGTDGGFTLTWDGRLVVIGAVTTAWDSAYQVVSVMGDRFVLVRLDPVSTAAAQGGRRCATSTMRSRCAAELSEAVSKLLAATDTGDRAPTSARPRLTTCSTWPIWSPGHVPRSSGTTRATRRARTGWRCPPGSPSSSSASSRAACRSA